MSENKCILGYTCVVRSVSSKHSLLCKCPPPFSITHGSHEHTYMYVQTASLCKCPPPFSITHGSHEYTYMYVQTTSLCMCPLPTFGLWIPRAHGHLLDLLIYVGQRWLRPWRKGRFAPSFHGNTRSPQVHTINSLPTIRNSLKKQKPCTKV